ncbi:MAG: DUF427 domain-containing protein [Bacteroidetes bacterium]|nr:hypothetical protein AWN76_005025 [Rhodothermaceae bacterium RA]RMH60484.1 MAG: DUF427 domain-containing protein [Bacteroidota bacterium]
MVPHRIEPGPGQESVWDYPRPPRVVPTDEHVRVVFNGMVIADTRRALRVLETSHPPGYYIPQEDVRMAFLHPTSRCSVCAWKGRARYYTVDVHGRTATHAAWSYPDPPPPYAALRGYLAFYPRLMDACYVDEEVVQPQEGDFFGGWITSRVVGPFKGAPGTWNW